MTSTYYILLSPLSTDSKSHNYTPRLFELSSATGEFTANEVLFSARSNEVEAFPFQQSDLYSAVQPGVCLVHSLGSKIRPVLFYAYTIALTVSVGLE